MHDDRPSIVCVSWVSVGVEEERAGQIRECCAKLATIENEGSKARAGCISITLRVFRYLEVKYLANKTS